jgi:hypothetical protein
MKVKTFLFLTIIMSALSSLFGQNGTEAVILYLEGTVDVTRDGVYLDYRDVNIGTVIQNYDMIETGSDGYVEIEVRTPVSAAVTLKVYEDTNFYYDTKQIRGNTKTSFQLLSGSLGMKVQKLYQDSELEVNVNNSVMGVRGTEFRISSTIDGSTLITTKEGKVSCKNDSGTEWFSTPGIVCETDENRNYREIAVPAGDIDEYRNKWMERRMEILRSNTLVSIRHYAKLYTEYYPRFDRSWQALEKKNEVFKKWYQYMRSGTTPALSDAVLSKQSVSREIIELRSVLPLFQHTFYVMKVLDKLYREGNGRGSLDIAMTQRELFDAYSRNFEETKRRLSQSLFYFRIYLDMGKRISGSDYSSESLLDSITSGSNMLIGPPKSNSPLD